MVKNEKITWPGWETVRLIGRGSFGAVYEIERDMLGEKEKAALKVITIPQSSSDIDELYSEGYDNESITNTFKAYLKSIVAEYSLMRKMNGSANVVNCDDVRYVEHDDGLGWDIYIKMELLTPLAKALGKEVSDEQVIHIGTDICKALILCKKHSIIHRDIKPANIFISENGDYKLGDFGIAKTVEKTSGGTKIGTYEYMAPEVYHDQPYGSTADLYSLGMVLYWLLNERRTPFLKLPPALPTNSEKEQARKRRFGGGAIPAPVHGSEELKRIVLKACAFDPKERYQSAEEMLRDLVNLSGEPAFFVSNEPNKTDATPSEDGDGTVGIFGAKKTDQTVDQQEATESAFQRTHRDEEEEQTVSAFAGGTPRQQVPEPIKKSKEISDQGTEKKQTSGTFGKPEIYRQPVANEVVEKQNSASSFFLKVIPYCVIVAVVVLAAVLFFTGQYEETMSQTKTDKEALTVEQEPTPIPTKITTEYLYRTGESDYFAWVEYERDTSEALKNVWCYWKNGKGQRGSQWVKNGETLKWQDSIPLDQSNKGFQDSYANLYYAEEKIYYEDTGIGQAFLLNIDWWRYLSAYIQFNQVYNGGTPYVQLCTQDDWYNNGQAAWARDADGNGYVILHQGKAEESPQNVTVIPR